MASMTFLFVFAFAVFTSTLGHVTEVDDEAGLDVARCTYFQGVETSVCCFDNFDVTNKDLKSFTSSNSYYSSWNAKGKSTPEACDDGTSWWRKCPCEYDSTLYDTDGSPAGTGICHSSETVICKKSCNKCDKDNYITAPRILASTKKETCCEFAEAYPFNCINKVVEEIYKPSILTMHVTELGICDAILTASTDFCLSFLYRRRASSTIPAKKLTQMIVCHTAERTNPTTDFDNFGVNPFCSEVNDKGDIVKMTEYVDGTSTGVVADKSEIKKEHCDFNTWVLGKKSLQIDCSAANRDKEEITFIVNRGVDHFDLDNVVLNRGKCTDEVKPTAGTIEKDDEGEGVLEYEAVYNW